MRNLALCIAASIGLAVPLIAHAEYAVMIAASSYCKAEVKSGPFGSGDANSLPTTLHTGPVNAGDSFRQGEGVRICARRSGDPANCNSGLTNWFCISPSAGISTGQPVNGSF